MHGDDAAGQAQADRDKEMGIGCCGVSETMGADVPRELLRLELRVMEGLEEGKEEGWADKKWEDEEEDKLCEGNLDWGVGRCFRRWSFPHLSISAARHI